MSLQDPVSLVADGPSATEIATDVRSGRRTARSAVDASLARIAEVEPTLNAFSLVLADSALAAADAIDALPAAEREALALAGVPIAIKAENDVAGVVTTFGGRGNTTPAAADSEIVRRLRAAGAVIVGTTAMPEFGQFPFTESVAHGVTRNPWAPDRSTGGSSGGTAAAVASGCVPVGLGGDGGGSIRIPSSCCGLIGLKPARGRVSMAPHASLWGTLGTAGPLTRTVADAALVYDVIRGVTKIDRWSAPEPAVPYVVATADRAPRRVAWLTAPALGPVRVDAQVASAVADTADRLAEAGHDVVRVEGRWPDVQAAFVPQFFASIRECVGLVEHPERLELRSRHTAALGAWARGPVLRQAEALGARARDAFLERFAGYDAVLSPTLACLPPTLGQLDGAGSIRALLRSLPMIAFTTVANTTGLPAMSVPAGQSTEGLPIGVQLSGVSDDEGPLLALAASLGL